VITIVRDNGKDPYGTSIRVIRQLKNAETEPPGSVFSVDLDATSENLAKAFGVAAVTPHQKYIFVYEEPHGELDRGHDLRVVLPANEQSLQAFLEGAACDPSVGEPIDWWRNQRPR
jgi:hypothetical protein